MDNQQVSVAYKPLRSNLINLPSHLVSLLYSANINIQDVVAELRFSPKPSMPAVVVYAGWSGMASGGSTGTAVSAVPSMEIDPTFAQSRGLASGLTVTLSLKLQHADATTIHLEPVSAGDWEVVELHALLLEDRLLSQCRCVQVGQVLVVYPTAGATALLMVTKIEPEPAKGYARIAPDCEVMVAPKLRPKKKKPKAKVVARAETLPSVLLRGLALPHAMVPVDRAAHQGFKVFVDVDAVGHRLDAAEYVMVSIIAGPAPALSEPKAEAPLEPEAGALVETKRVCARVAHCAETPEGHVGLSPDLALALSVEGSIGHMVVLQKTLIPTAKAPSTVVFHPYITKTPVLAVALNSTDAQKEAARDAAVHRLAALQEEVALWGTTPVTNFARVAVLEALPLGGLLEFKRSTESWALGTFRAELGGELLRAESFVAVSVAQVAEEIVGMAATVAQVEGTIMRGNVGAMLYGASGSGKTAVVTNVVEGLNRQGVYTRTVLCDRYATETFNVLRQQLLGWVAECGWHSPLCLILENAENLFAADAEHADGTQSNQLAECLAAAMQRVGNLRNVSLLCTSPSKEAVNKLLFQLHTVEESFNLKTPDKELRRLVVEAEMERREVVLAFDVMDAVAETEGYLPNDLKILLDRAHHEALFQSGDQSLGEGHALQHPSKTDGPQHLSKTDGGLAITLAQFRQAVAGYTPSNLRGVKLQKSTINWEDIGGLEEAKTILLETLEWPTKYAPIFQSCPLRLRSGILLYGYPGCGKTLLASAIAGACGLNFISIKGPEILNKYIGASEQSVRELFERASSAKPCILFFDEFDSIAPKRGHDSTGVTDRVVNQMLTQMDGAEGLDGVYVLAATSRPDLIDSALLRPGRLDKSVICDMPSLLDRLSILKSVTRKMELVGVLLEEVASQTEGYSGADLQGLGYNAYLKAVHRKLDHDEAALVGGLNEEKKAREFFQIKQRQQLLRATERVKVLQQIERLFDNIDLEAGAANEAETTLINETVKVYLNHQDFVDSLAETKPSISASEKAKLNRIYSEFVSDRDGNMPDGSTSNDVGGRTTLM